MDTSPLRVTHVIHGLGPGGAERVLLDLAEAAPAAGMQLSVLSLMPLAEHSYPDELRRRGASVSTLELGSRWDARALQLAARRIATTSPDVVHTHLKHADLVGGFAAHRLGVPLVSTLHLVEDAPSALGRVKRLLAAQARLRIASRTVAVSDAVRQWYLAMSRADPDRVVTVHNGITPPVALTDEERARLRAEIGVPGGAAMVTLVGVMRPGKGHEAAVAMARGLPRDRDVRVVLVGDGPRRAELERSAAEDVRGGRVIFAGYRTDVSAVLQCSDVQVSASDFDALPTVLIEGLAAATPAVAYAVGGVPEIVTPDTGCLRPAGDTAGLADAVTALLADPALRLRLGTAGRQRFEREFAASAWAGRLRALYGAVLAER